MLISFVIGAVFWDILIAIGVVAVIVPVEVPIAVEIIDVIKNTPGTKKYFRINVNPKFTIDSTPAVILAASWNPPDNKYIKLIIITPGFPAPSLKIYIFLLMLIFLLIIIDEAVAINKTTCFKNFLNGFSTPKYIKKIPLLIYN